MGWTEKYLDELRNQFLPDYLDTLFDNWKHRLSERSNERLPLALRLMATLDRESLRQHSQPESPIFCPNHQHLGLHLDAS